MGPITAMAIGWGISKLFKEGGGAVIEAVSTDPDVGEARAKAFKAAWTGVEVLTGDPGAMLDTAANAAEMLESGADVKPSFSTAADVLTGDATTLVQEGNVDVLSGGDLVNAQKAVVKHALQAVHSAVRCDGCGTKGFTGNRYKCDICSNYDLCGSCYHGKRHYLSHDFTRYERPGVSGTRLIPREPTHPTTTCDGCGVKGFAGNRYKCDICYNYDLCASCYQGNKHYLSHDFTRYEYADAPGTRLIPRKPTHPTTTCDGCGVKGFTGNRYKCDICYNYDLCASCYQGNKHYLSHDFTRYEYADAPGTRLIPRKPTHPTCTCDGCGVKGFAGNRYKCNSCYNYDLCVSCYQNNRHYLSHEFTRYKYAEDPGTSLAARSETEGWVGT